MEDETGTSPKRWRFDRETAWLPVMLLPGLMTVALAFRSGGFYVGATSLAAAEMALLLGLRFALSRRPLQGISIALIVAVVAMAGLAGWTLLSSNWSDSLSRALPAYSRALLYGLVLVFFGLLPFNPRRVRWMVYGLASAVVVICAAALTARLLPHTIFDPTLVREYRLGYPLTYWNALGILSCVGVVFCAHLACSTRDSPVARVLGAAAVPLLALTLTYTLSRGGIWAAAGALVIYVALGRPRALLSGALATIPPTAFAVMVATPVSAVTEGYPNAMVSTGKHVALTLGFCMLGAALLRASLLPLDGWLARLRLPIPDRARKPALAVAAGLALVLVLAAGTAADAPHLVSAKYHEFTDQGNTSPEIGESRLFSARPEGRFDLWHVALDSYRENELHGTGAGTYVLRWEQHRPDKASVQNAHSLYIEVLGELGLVGLVLLLIALALILGAFAFRARGPDRALFAALLAAGLAWSVHAGVDWDWQMPAVTLWLFALGGATLARTLRLRRHRYRSELKRFGVRAGGVAACLLVAILPAQVALSQARLNSAIEALNSGQCGPAEADANSALSAVGQRPTPYVVIAYCDMKLGHYGSATVALQRALQRDPGNWELHYDLAVARAGAGLDPEADARRAAALNPFEDLASSAPSRLRGRGARDWERAALSAPVLPPGFGDP
jgi:tetratricopeptide (TPR) repeat protein